MKKLLYLILVFLLHSCGTSYEQYSEKNLAKIQIIDRNGLSETISNEQRVKKYQDRDFLENQPFQQVTRIFSVSSQNGKTPSILTSYYPNGQIWKYLESLDNRAFGIYKEWHENGNIKVHAHIIGGIADLSLEAQKSWLFDKKSSVWNEKNEQIACITYKKGYLHGPSIYYTSNGRISKMESYEKGALHGEVKQYNSKEQVDSIITYKNGKKEGISIEYWENGSLKSLEEFIHDKLISGSYYDLKQNKINEVIDGFGTKIVFRGNLIHKTIEYKSGKAEGKVQILNQNGFCIEEYFIQNEMKHGQETQFFLPTELSDIRLSPQPKIQISWKNGVIHGVVKSWYPNGHQESHKEFSNHMKNGTFTCWYLNGSLMLTEEYENDQLVKGVYYKPGQIHPVSQVAHGQGIATIFDQNGVIQKKIPYEKGIPCDE